MHKKTTNTTTWQETKKYIGYSVLAVAIILGAYAYGTFTPNHWVKKKIIADTEQESVDRARALGFMIPEFVYNDNKTFVQAVRKCVDYLNLLTDPHHRVPSAIIISMAVIESAYGTSRFAVEGNALFGVRTWNLKQPHMKPLGIENAQFGVKKYTHKCESVSDMIHIINTHPAYEKFRVTRNSQYDSGKLDYAELLEGLKSWSVNEEYTEIIMDKIKQLKLP
jgi:uncharacterized FlgJ-related protein